MSRKGMFEGIVPQAGDVTTKKSIPGAFQNGPVGAIGMELRNASGRAIMDVEIEQIDLGNQSDRIEITDEDVRELRDAIVKNGQQVPILVRPSPDAPDRYQVVYGRRRVHAMRGLGKPVRALVRSMSDEEVLIAQSQENALRRDPSFIEKALFARSLTDLGYNQTLVADSLSIDRSVISRMSGILAVIPDELIQAIGPAHGIGRGSWAELAAKLKASNINPLDLITADLPDLESDKRFNKVFSKASEPAASKRSPAVTRTVVSGRGVVIGEVKTNERTVSLHVDRRKNAEFSVWLDQNAQEALKKLHDDFSAQKG